MEERVRKTKGRAWKADRFLHVFVGQNVAIACSQYGETDKVTVRPAHHRLLSHLPYSIIHQVFQATGGMTGRYISSYLDELHIEHVTGESIIFSVFALGRMLIISNW